VFILNQNNEIIKKVEEKILIANNLDLSYIEKMLAKLNGKAIDFGDIYFQHSIKEGWGLDDHIVKNGAFSISQGFGVRGVIGEKTALAFSDEINERALDQTIRAASSISRLQGAGSADLCVFRENNFLYDNLNPMLSITRARKTEILREIDNFAHKLDSRVVRVTASVSTSYVHSLVATTDGVLAADIKPKTTMRCTIIVEKNGERENGHSSSAIVGNYSYFEELVPVLPDNYIVDITDTSNIVSFEKRYLAIARDAVRSAIVNLNAREAVAAKMPVVLASGWPAVLIHEAVGHGLEGDAIRKSSSVFAGKLGQYVASDLCTVVDDGTLLGRTGTNNFDSEGTPSAENVLIENGVFKAVMYDKLNANLMKTSSTGNGRRSSFKMAPIPRMTNTYLKPGKSKPEEIISSLDQGIYAVNFNGGQVDPTSGNFTFTASEAYYVENGKIQYPVKGVTLIGNCLDEMKKITMVGDNLKFDKGCGYCGKAGQSVPVGIGQPMLRIEDITIGGTK
jgi:TldD protein